MSNIYTPTAPLNDPIAESNHFIVLNEYVRARDLREPAAGYQSEKDLEDDLIRDLQTLGYEYLPQLNNPEALLCNARTQLEKLNNLTFTDSEWERFLVEYLDKPGTPTIEQTRRVQVDHICDFKFDDGHLQNVYLVDKDNVRRNRLQVIHQFEQKGTVANRYDVTILVNGIPMVQVELKKRGVNIREAFYQVHRYSKESFNADRSLFKYLQIFVISNGTDTRYFANTTKRNKDSFDFTMNWALEDNSPIKDLQDFTATFFQQNTLLQVLLRYTVLDVSDHLLIMRPYQIAATERILWKVRSAYLNKVKSGPQSGGYVWHTTGSGKTLTSFKAARLATQLDFVDKVFFVVDRKDLDYQTMKEYQRFQPDSVNGSIDTRALRDNLEKQDNKIVVTTLQKLNILLKKESALPIYRKHCVFIFDECHRSQFGEAQKNLQKRFSHYYQFGFTGTPIFAENALQEGETTAAVFGALLHSYKITDAIRDDKVLKFKVDYNEVRPVPVLFPPCDAMTAQPTAAAPEGTSENVGEGSKNVGDFPKNVGDFPKNVGDFSENVGDFSENDGEDSSNDGLFAAEAANSGVPAYRMAERVDDFEKLSNADVQAALMHPRRIAEISAYILKNFKNKTHRMVSGVQGFNAMLAVSSVKAARLYYHELKRQMTARGMNLRIATIFSFAPNEEQSGKGDIVDETFNPNEMDASAKEFLMQAIDDYNLMFGTSFTIDSEGFQNYYRDLCRRLKHDAKSQTGIKEAHRPWWEERVDLVIVVGMLLTGFDAPGMNTLFVDKNLRYHGLIQAFSRTNRIYDGTKTFGNIVCFRDLENATKEALRLFGKNQTEDPVTTVLERGYEDFLKGYDDERGHHHKGYVEVVQQLEEQFPDPTNLVEEQDKRAFAHLFGQYLRLENVLQNFDEFVQLRELHESIPAGDAKALEEFQQTNGISDEKLEEMQAVVVLTTRRVQDCTSVYHDIREWIKRKRQDAKQSSLKVDWDNVVFEVDLLRSQEINLDYILHLIYDYHKMHSEKAALIEEVRRVIRASLGQRAKESLIVDFIECTDLDTIAEREDIIPAFYEFAQQRRDEERDQLIADEGLRPEAAHHFIDFSLRRGYASNQGTDLDEILPFKVSPLDRNSRAKRNAVLERISAFVEKFTGI